MKFTHLTLFLLLFFLSSCYTWKRFDRDIGADKVNAKEKDRKYFIEVKDGSTLDVDNKLFSTNFLANKDIVINQGTTVKPSDIIAFQNDAGYFKKIDGSFEPRIIHGAINVYKSSQSVSYSSTHYGTYPGTAGVSNINKTRTGNRPLYIIQKGNGEPEELSGEGVKDMVKDNPSVMPIMEEYFRVERNIKMWKWINTGVVLGGMTGLAIEGGKADVNEDLTAGTYASFGLVGVGLASGMVNKNKKAKNPLKLFEAINEYNRLALAKPQK